MVTDDESLTRHSTIRIIKSCAKELGYKINIIEAEDGIDAIYCVYKSWTLGIHISMILSDENMIFLNGTKCSQVLYDLCQKHKKPYIPFYLVTAYEGDYIKRDYGTSIKVVISKPLEKSTAKKLIEENNN